MILGNVVLITRLTGAMIQPLMTLAVQADAVAKGNFDVKELPVQAQDEIGIVTRAFNQMVSSIRRYIARIREQMEVERELKEKELMMVTPKEIDNVIERAACLVAMGINTALQPGIPKEDILAIVS